ncbi:MAG: hypothetical protein ACI4TX_03180, partial [Christensenellales bacterium]
TLNVADFGNEWQGATVSIGLTVQALQSSHVGIDDFSVYVDNQVLVNAIAGVVVVGGTETIWDTEFNKPIYEKVTNL